MNISIAKLTEQKHKPTNVGRIALERQAGRKTFDPTGIRAIALQIFTHMHIPLGYQDLILAMLQPTLY